MRFDNFIANFRSYWTDRTARGMHSVAAEAIETDYRTVSANDGHRRDSVQDKRKTAYERLTGKNPDKNESSHVRKTDKQHTPAEVFKETLRIVNELFPERRYF